MVNRVFLFIFLMMWAVSAHAYIDPTSTLLLIQGALAAIGGALFVIRHPIQTIKNLINKLRNRGNE
jgi:hypothetical protein